MAGIEDILAQLPIGDIAAKLGIDSATAEQAVKEGGATILGGLSRNAESADGAASIEKALQKHTGSATIDEADGSKILGHIFGGDTDAVASQLTNSDKTAGIDFAKLLPVIAPIIMNLIANKSGAAQQTSTTEASSGGGIGDVIGGLLGGLGGGGNSSAGGLDIGGILGGLGGLFGKK